MSKEGLHVSLETAQDVADHVHISVLSKGQAWLLGETITGTSAAHHASHNTAKVLQSFGASHTVI